MSGIKAVLDSNAIIFASKGIVDAERMLSETGNYYASIISFIEVYAYDFTNPAEKEIIDEILEGLEIIELRREIADQAIIYRKNKSKKIKLPDAVILATTQWLNADLITNNHADFVNVDSSVNIVNLDDSKFRPLSNEKSPFISVLVNDGFRRGPRSAGTEKNHHSPPPRRKG